jgi:hypothetical protein
VLKKLDFDFRYRPRLCENVRDFDAIGTAHHFGSSLVEADSLKPTLVCLQ